MVANAGIAIVKPLVERACMKFYFIVFLVIYSLLLSSTVSAEEFDKVISVNLRGVMLCYKYAAIQMIKQGGGGRIIGKKPSLLAL